MKILVLNAGSSSLKFQLIDMETTDVLAKGNVEKINDNGSFLKYKANGKEEVFNAENSPFFETNFFDKSSLVKIFS